MLDYNELYSRNRPIITPSAQTQLSRLRVAVAGCGSTGGAFLDGILRLGVTHFKITDSGSYELNNLNRQMVTIREIGKNKATVYAERIKSLNPQAHVELIDGGLTDQNVKSFVEGVDLVFDAVDVTTPTGMSAKLALHRWAADVKVPVASALDLGYTQWIRGYNYHKGIKPLDGRLEQVSGVRHPIKALVEGFCPLDEMPNEALHEIGRLLTAQGETSACQLACACFLLSALATPYTLTFVEKGELPTVVSMDLTAIFTDDISKRERLESRPSLLKQARELLAKME